MNLNKHYHWISYIYILAWLSLTIFVSYYYGYLKYIELFTKLNYSLYKEIIICILISISLLLFIYAILNFIISFDNWFSLILGRSIKKEHIKIQNNKSILPNPLPSVAILYCTYNDFHPNYLLKSMQQTYSNVKFYIMDQSTDITYINMIKDFVKINPNVTLLQNKKEDMKYQYGIPASYNFFFKNIKHNWDYIIHHSADVYLPNDYVIKMIPYFYSIDNLGAISPSLKGIKTNNIFNNFMYLDSHQRTSIVQSFRSKCYNNNLNGEGMVVSKKLFEKISFNFPDVCANDHLISLLCIKNGMKTIASIGNYVYEKIIVDYIAYKKQRCRWTMSGWQLYRDGWYKMSKDTPFVDKFRLYQYIVNSFLSPLTIIIGLILPILYTIFEYKNESGLLPLIITIIPLIANYLYIFVIYVGKEKIIDIVNFCVFVAIGPPSLFFNLLEMFFQTFILRKKTIFTITAKFKQKRNFLSILWSCRRNFFWISCLALSSCLLYFYAIPETTRHKNLIILSFDTHIPNFFTTFIGLIFIQLCAPICCFISEIKIKYHI